MTDRDGDIAFLRTVRAAIAAHENAIQELTRTWVETFNALRADGMDSGEILLAVLAPSDQSPPDPSE